jgi:ribokinase
MIVLTPDGQNSIIVLPHATAELRGPDAARASSELAPALVLTQLEVPAEVTLATAGWCVLHGARFLLNFSPIRATPGQVLALADPLIVNELEAAALLGGGWGPFGYDQVADAVRQLAKLSRSVVLTLGEKGVVVGDRGQVDVIDAVPTRVVDTTGAGDAFAGCLAAGLAAGEGLAEAASLANAAAASLVGLPRGQR